jgi:hypothetical protein
LARIRLAFAFDVVRVDFSTRFPLALVYIAVQVLLPDLCFRLPCPFALRGDLWLILIRVSAFCLLVDQPTSLHHRCEI